MIKRDAIRVELRALPDKDEWILSASLSIERGAKIVREPDVALDVEIFNASEALKDMIFAQLYADLRHDVANIRTLANAPNTQLDVALSSLLSKLQ